jgi:hypothetical protein
MIKSALEHLEKAAALLLLIKDKDFCDKKAPLIIMGRELCARTEKESCSQASLSKIELTSITLYELILNKYQSENGDDQASTG